MIMDGGLKKQSKQNHQTFIKTRVYYMRLSVTMTKNHVSSLDC